MRMLSVWAMPLMIVGIVAFGMAKRINVYQSFTDGAKVGLENMVAIVPPLVGLMVGITMLRSSGAIDLLGCLLSPMLKPLGIPTEVLPLALLRPVSGSGSVAIVGDLMKNFGPDSLVGKIASVMMGSTETTFYTVAVYFGAVGIKNSRHTLKSALIADFTGIMLSIYITKLFFGF